MNRTYLFIIISSAALVIVLIIQVNWIFQTAKIKENLFNEKASMVLSRTTEALAADQETCQKIDACVHIDSTNGLTARLGKHEAHKIDSLFQHYMDRYNFHINYSFVVTKPNVFRNKAQNNFSNTVYNQSLDRFMPRNSIDLKLIFPEKRQFIIAEMGSMFITSIILILIVLILFWQTILSLMKEKNISQQTTDFLNNMTHELKTPLTNIALAGKMMLKNLHLNRVDKLQHYVEILLAENNKLSTQVEQVLDIAALNQGEIPLHKTALDMHQLIQQSLPCIHLQLEPNQGELHLNLAAQNAVVWADKTHVNNALHNLIDNAIKYSPEKAILSIQTYNQGQQFVLSIADQGIGIEKAYQKKVFDAFFRVPTGNLHDVKGFGIGLAYLKKIIDLHQGSIELQSEKGKGTTFIITLANC